MGHPIVDIISITISLVAIGLSFWNLYQLRSRWHESPYSDRPTNNNGSSRQATTNRDGNSGSSKKRFSNRDESTKKPPLKCPICMNYMEFEFDQVKLNCQHVFHSACIREWLNKSDSCPICGAIQYEMK